MTTLDRYLRSVRFWLPRDQRDDIIAELSEDLHSQIEERERSLGRSLTEAELDTLLKHRGTPMAVAGRYLPQRYLIGPAVFPIYRTILTGWLLFYLLPATIVGMVLLLSHAGISSLTWGSLFGWVFRVAAYAFAIMTLVFAMIDRSQAKVGGLDAWEKRTPDPLRVSRFEAITELVAGAIGLLIWVKLIPVGKLDDVTFSLGPSARLFYLPILLWLVSGIVMGAVQLRYHRWTRQLATYRIAQTIFGLLIFTGMLVTWLVDGSLVSVSGTNLSVEKIAEAEKWMSITWAGIIAGFVVGFGIATIYDVRRLRQTRLPQSAIGTAAALAMMALVVPNPVMSQQVETASGSSAVACPQAARWPSAAERGGWTGWSADPANTRFQRSTNAGLTAADLPRLKLRWAFSLGDITEARAQPTIAGGRVFVGTTAGNAYAIDAKTGCIHWTFKADGPIHTAMAIGTAGSPGTMAFFGDQKANVYAVNAATGNISWKVHVDDHPAAIVTGTPLLHGSTLYVPVSSYEEAMVFAPGYECCSFRGSVVALDAATGRTIWKTYTIADTALPTVNSKTGAKRRGPSGAAVWSSPTYDQRTNAIYLATGNNYSDPPTGTSDAVLALEARTGKVLWTRQLLVNDATNMGCDFPGKPGCPDSDGPDADFAQPPILVSLGGGHRALVIGQKSGIAYALDPDSQGEVLWTHRVAKGGKLGGMQWGSAADGEHMYAAISDVELRPYADAKAPAGFSLDLAPDRGGGLVALDLATGTKAWRAAPAQVCAGKKHCGPGQSSAVTAIPGAIFSGSVDGHLRAYSAATGAVLWDYDSMQEYETVNRTPGRGGSIDGGGVAIADGLLVTGSGYGMWGGTSGNVVLGFSVDGK